MENIILQRKIHFSTARIKATIAKASKRPELMPVLKRIQEMSAVNATDIAQHLLFEPVGRKKVATRLLEITKILKLTDESNGFYELTKDGKKAVTQEQIFIPAEGIWEINLSNDPLLPFEILSIKDVLEKSAREERRDAKERLKDIVDFEKWKKLIIGKQGIPCFGGDEIRLDSIEDEGEVIDNKEQFIIKWNVTNNSLMLNDNNKSFPQTAPAEIEFDEIWQELLKGEELDEDWDDDNKLLNVSFDDCSNASRSSMKRDIIFHNPKIGDHGVFDDCNVKNIAITASKQDDADRWIQWRLYNYINDYAVHEKFIKWAEQAKTPFEKYFAVDSPAREQFARDKWQEKHTTPDAKLWYLIAAEDWNL